MKANGFEIRIFNSIEEYLTQKDLADIWYFTRLQLERMGEKILEKAPYLRKSVTFMEENIARLKEDTKFFHPLPRHRITPTIPSFLDNTPLNGWDLQSINGYYTRITELGMFGGKLGHDFDGNSIEVKSFDEDFVQEAEVSNVKKHDYKVGIKPVENGIVIDHIGRGEDISIIWDHINKIRKIMKFNCTSSHGVYHSKPDTIYKGMISLPGISSFNRKELKKLGSIAPGCTFNIIRNHKVEKKYRIKIPPRIYNFDEISCNNENCISFPDHHEHVMPIFLRAENNTFICKYCEKKHTFHEIWHD
jgi:aspartate carbamoyltransferase